ncbi:hypothetical protein MAE02_66770 [Microvirga aerophila]|uniref:Uncharacterized protein n=1 Tax=Microvirga aerophila TaxID=670291 RepID=A0A512C437_9HYPH|nr:hypothetical protein MAE02_66770 [Microvirga aerophila]
MRILTIAITLGLLVGSPSLSAQEKTPQGQTPKASPSKIYSAEESAALSDASRKKAERLEQARDRKMKSISRGICTGC